MKIKTITVVLTISLCLTLCSCSYQHRSSSDLYEAYVRDTATNSDQHRSSLSLYEVYVCDAATSSDLDKGDIEYNKADRLYSFPKQTTNVNKKEADKQYQIGAGAVDLKYECTYNKDYCEFYVNSYSDETYGIKANFRVDNGSLNYLRLGSYEYKIFDGVIDTESKLMDICTRFLSEYVDDLDRYDANIVTRIQTVDDHGADNQSYDGYVSPTAYTDSSVSYQVDFIYYIKGIKTSDIISMRIDSNGYLELLSFDTTGDFESFDDSDIDVTYCEQLISSEMKKMCDVENYLYEGYTDSRMLIILSGKLCMLSYAKPIYKLNDDTVDILVPSVQLLIPVAE